MYIIKRKRLAQGLDYSLLNSIKDEVIYIGPDRKIRWLNESAKGINSISEGQYCFHGLCSRTSPCENCILYGDEKATLCEKNFSKISDKIVGHYSVGEGYGEGVLLVIGDITSYSSSNNSKVQTINDHDKLFHEANHDQLTSLYNRRYMNYLFNMISNDKRDKKQDTKTIISLIDIDKFKQINDEHGHAVGDEVLKVIAHRIKSEIRKTDTAIRIGGDEFLIIHTQHNDYNILNFIKRLIDSINKPVHLEDGRVLKISISIGILLNAQNYDDLEKAVKLADHALYEAKEKSQSESNYVIFGKDLEKEINHNKILAESLDQAVSENDLSVYYQPIVSLNDNRICGIEGLTRWLTVVGNNYKPEEYLPIAETRSTIIHIGEQLLEKVLFDIKKYEKYLKHYDFISINFSARQFMSERYVNFMKELIVNTEADCRRLKIEVTEASLLQNIKRTKKIVKNFRDMGIEVILDDFGKGYSSLSYLLEYDIKKIKIDRQFISNIHRDDYCLKLVSTLVSIARIYDLEIFVKGVETKEQYDIVKDLGCHYAQGYYISKPQSIENYVKFARNYYMKLNQLTLLPPKSTS
jgi:diguanylate cyclase (GGDEF)-like protein